MSDYVTRLFREALGRLEGEYRGEGLDAMALAARSLAADESKSYAAAHAVLDEGARLGERFDPFTYPALAMAATDDAIRRGGLALDGPVGAAILAHRPDAAGLVFQQGQMGAQGFGRRAGQRRALTGAPALMPELLVLALAAAGRVPDDGCFAAAAAHNVVVSKNIQD